MTRREIVLTVLVVLVCAAALVGATILLATGQLAPQPGSGLP
jgi:hypothetical protein